MRRTITFFDLLANNESSARAAKDVMEDFGYQVRFHDEASFAQCLKEFFRKEDADGNGEGALKALARVHPHRELILHSASTEELRGADGFAELAPPVSAVTPQKSSKGSGHKMPDYMPLLIVTGILASALFLSSAIIAKK